jgi:predicted membrane metal-binding protein
LLVDEMQIISLVYMVIVSQKHVALAFGTSYQIISLACTVFSHVAKHRKATWFFVFFLINMVFFNKYDYIIIFK